MNMNKTFRDMRTLLDKPEAWTKNSLARDEAGDGVYATYECAVSWCLIGAALKVMGNARCTLLDEVHVFDLMEQHIPQVDKTRRDPYQTDKVVLFNNHPDTTHQDIIDLLDKMIEVTQ